MIQVMLTFIMNYLIKQIWLWSTLWIKCSHMNSKNMQKTLYGRIQTFKIEIKLQREVEKINVK